MRTRIISGIVLGAILIATLSISDWTAFGLSLIISLIGIYELNKVKKIEKSPIAMAGYISVIAYYSMLLWQGDENALVVLIMSSIIMMSLYVFLFPKYAIEDVMWVFFGIIYVSVMLSYIYQVRIMPNGIYIVWLIFVSSWGNDTCAYFTGVFFGKHKMAPVLSPKKTIEGAVGGVVGATLLGFLYGYIISPVMEEKLVHPVYTFAAACFVGAVLSIIGDLAASAIKRNHNVKDYGIIIPGHGGIMDRFDSVIFTAPAVYCAISIINNVFGG